MESIQSRTIIMFINKMLSFQLGSVLEAPLCNTTLYKAQFVLVNRKVFAIVLVDFCYSILFSWFIPWDCVFLEIFQLTHGLDSVLRNFRRLYLRIEEKRGHFLKLFLHIKS